MSMARRDRGQFVTGIAYCEMYARRTEVRRQMSRDSAAQRFWSRVNKDGRVVRAELGPCWEWTAGCSTRGYGRINVGGKKAAAHRVSWEMENGAVSGAMLVLHHCDNRRCVRPSHLFLGTHQDNTDDMIAKGRANLSGLALGRNKGDRP